MKVYTKTGDKGQTGLIGDRVSKSHPRIHIIGMLDDVMVQLGGLISAIEDIDLLKKTDLKRIYKLFFIIQSKLADVDNQYGLLIEDVEIQFLEESIDQMSVVLPKLRNFIYYTGHKDALMAQAIRTNIRSVERMVVQLDEDEKAVEDLILIYLNRASDYFYTLGRYINFIHKVEEEIMKL